MLIATLHHLPTRRGARLGKVSLWLPFWPHVYCDTCVLAILGVQRRSQFTLSFTFPS